MKKSMVKFVPYILFLGFLNACGGGGSDGAGDTGGSQLLQQINGIETQIEEDLNTYNSDTDFTLYIRSETGYSYIHSTGVSTENTSYESASTSKWVTAAVILHSVIKGELSLDNNPQQYINGWQVTGNQSLIELKHLLNFTSGLVNEPICIHSALSDFEGCIETISDNNINIAAPGADYYYASTHLQVAGLMAVKAAGMQSWTELFARFKEETGLFPTSTFDLPSSTNPRLAGGMHWTATEYIDFLEALYHEEILSTELIELMTTDQLGDATISYSPALDALGYDWHYGYGVWIECNSAEFDCDSAIRISSPGAYGAYPFIDFNNGVFGILAREGDLGTFAQGYNTFYDVVTAIESWAELQNRR